MTSFEIVKFEDVKIILIENFPCKTKYELLAREQYYIDNNICVNKQRSLRTESRSVYDKTIMKTINRKYLNIENNIINKHLTVNVVHQLEKTTKPNISKQRNILNI